ncbi:cystatin-A [Nannospalax galili]|nr:cystatin-A [Nannospalax galili]
MVPGGLSKAKPATPEIQEMANKVKAQVEEQTNQTYEEYKAVEYKTQVVAGINYFIKMCVAGDQYIHLKIFIGLSGQNDLVFGGCQTNKTKDDELTYF